ncbi:ABC transporter substrate-binding protein [Natrinema amylolyticum]|uniref:ABC transporter substrate-binding protein n=1 Tax=Natrinema amylolyticum TaxID=2878679 RepID=UPI003CCDE3C4
MGEVEFQEAPERWTALLPSYADMGFALGGGETLGIQGHDRHATEAYDELPGVEYDVDGIRELNDDGVDKEVFYEMAADIHFMEPNQLINWYGWSEADVADIESATGPFLGNFIRRRSDDWHDYRYYDLYEAFELLAEVFRERERYEAFVDLHDEMLATIDERLPPAEARPAAMLVYPADEPPTEFYPYRFDDGGVSTKQWRDLGLTDALVASDVGHYMGDGGTVDLETILEVDPDVLLVRGQEGVSESAFRESIIEPLQDDAAASEVTAIQEEAVYNGGYLDQGPIINFYQTELAAKDIYPDAFADATLFDRERVANIVTGGF